MAKFGLCKGDPLVETLRKTFGANIVRVPETRVQPMCAVAVRDKKVVFRGDFRPLLAGAPDLTIPDDADAVSQMSSLSGKQSRSVKLGLGLDILGQFLSGFGVPSIGIAAEFEGATEVAFTFQAVQRHWIDVNWLGRALTGKTLDPQQQAAKIYLYKPQWSLLLIDSVIASSDFTINVTKSKGTSFGLDVPVFQTLIANAKAHVTVEQTSSRQLTFRGDEALTFAFTAVQLYVDQYGNILSMLPGGDSVVMSKVAESGGVASYGLDHIELSSEPAWVEWDEIN
jgi:hypothetical protein